MFEQPVHVSFSLVDPEAYLTWLFGYAPYYVQQTHVLDLAPIRNVHSAYDCLYKLQTELAEMIN